MNEQPYTLKDVYGDLTPNCHRDCKRPPWMDGPRYRPLPILLVSAALFALGCWLLAV